MIYPRFIQSALEIALADTPCVLLTGPRQSGKTTLIKQWTTPSTIVSFDNWSVLHQAKNDPEGFVERLVAVHQKQLLVMDEIQHIPELFLPIKRMIDANRRAGMFLLTGSANLLSWSKTPDSLAGRVEYLPLYPLSLLEIKDKKHFWLNELFEAKDTFPNITTQLSDSQEQEIDLKISQGGFPEAIKREDLQRRGKWFESYLKSLLERDIFDISRIEQPLLLHNLLSHLAYRCGSTVNFTDLAAKLPSSVQTVKKYFSLLEMMFLICPLPVWHRNLGKRLVKSPKVYLIDSGLLTYLLNSDLVNINNRGRIFEQFIFNELQKQISWVNQSLRLFYWRTTDGKEVDFIVENRRNQIIGIEVKAKTTLIPSDWSSLKLLETHVGDDFLKGIVIYTGKNLLPLSPKMWAVPISWFF